jgi:hypothetical protein
MSASPSRLLAPDPPPAQEGATGACARRPLSDTTAPCVREAASRNPVAGCPMAKVRREAVSISLGQRWRPCRFLAAAPPASPQVRCVGRLGRLGHPGPPGRHVTLRGVAPGRARRHHLQLNSLGAHNGKVSNAAIHSTDESGHSTCRESRRLASPPRPMITCHVRTCAVLGTDRLTPTCPCCRHLEGGVPGLGCRFTRFGAEWRFSCSAGDINKIRQDKRTYPAQPSIWRSVPDTGQPQPLRALATHTPSGLGAMRLMEEVCRVKHTETEQKPTGRTARLRRLRRVKQTTKTTCRGRRSDRPLAHGLLIVFQPQGRLSVLAPLCHASWGGGGVNHGLTAWLAIAASDQTLALPRVASRPAPIISQSCHPQSGTTTHPSTSISPPKQPVSCQVLCVCPE